MIEIFGNVLNDLKVYAHYIGGIIDIQQEDQESLGIALKTRSKIRENAKNIALQLINKEQMKQQMQDSQQSKHILFDEREYWDYLAGGEFFDNSSDGLLNFIIDCIQLYKQKNQGDLNTDNELYKLFMEIKKIVTRIQESIIKIEIEKDKNCHQNFQSINLLINSIIKILDDEEDSDRNKDQLNYIEDM